MLFVLPLKPLVTCDRVSYSAEMLFVLPLKPLVTCDRVSYSAEMLFVFYAKYITIKTQKQVCYYYKSHKQLFTTSHLYNI